MGKGDIKTTKGKRFAGSYGNTRKRKKSTPYVAEEKPKKKTTAKKATVKKETTAKKTTAKKTTTKKTTAKTTKKKAE